MVGVPRSKGCSTCRTRRIKVRNPPVFKALSNRICDSMKINKHIDQKDLAEQMESSATKLAPSADNVENTVVPVPGTIAA